MERDQEPATPDRYAAEQPKRPSLYPPTRLSSATVSDDKPAPIASEISNVEFWVEELGASLRRLEETLNPILTPIPPHESPIPDNESGQSVLYNRLANVATRLKAFTEYVNSINGKVEV